MARKFITALVAAALMALVAVSVASASGHQQWFHHTLGNGRTVCNQSSTVPNVPDGGPFDSKSSCEDFTAPDDACPNLEGVQATVPVGDVIDELGNCVPGDGPPAPTTARVVLPPPPNHMFLCYSKFETDGGAVFLNAQALKLLADPTSGYWAPFAILGKTTDGPNISGYHLACNPTGVKPTGQYLYANNDGLAEIAPFNALVAGDAGYPIAG